MSDFVAPKGSGVRDYLGMFACSAGHGLDEVIAKHKEVRACSRWPGASRGQLIWALTTSIRNLVRTQNHDDFSYIMAEALADRLAEAFAEKLHEITRREWWGYAPDEQLSNDDLLKVKYQVSTNNRE